MWIRACSCLGFCLLPGLAAADAMAVCRTGASPADVVVAIACSLPQAHPAWVLQTPIAPHEPFHSRSASSERTAHIEWLRDGRRLGASVILHRSPADIETVNASAAHAGTSESADAMDAVQSAFAIAGVAEQAWLWPPKTPRGGTWNLRFLQGVVEVWMSGVAKEELVASATQVAQSIPAMAPPQMVTVALHYAWPAEDNNQFSVHSSERELCRMQSVTSGPGEAIRGVCRFELPLGTEHIEVRGSYMAQDWDRSTRTLERHRVSGGQRLILRDASALTAPLRNADLPWRERWMRSIAAEQALANEHGGEQLTEISDPVDQTSLMEAEARLGLKLPQGYWSLIGAVGRIEFGASRWSSGDIILPPHELQTGEQTLLRWGYQEDGRLPEWIPAAAVERLRQSVVLFIEHGDGMGAQLVRVAEDAAADGIIETAHLHEESLDEAMQRLGREGWRRMPFLDLVSDLHARCVLGRHESEIQAGELLFDFSTPRERFVLRFGGEPSRQFQVALDRVQSGWDGLR